MPTSNERKKLSSNEALKELKLVCRHDSLGKHRGRTMQNVFTLLC